MDKLVSSILVTLVFLSISPANAQRAQVNANNAGDLPFSVPRYDRLEEEGMDKFFLTISHHWWPANTNRGIDRARARDILYRLPFENIIPKGSQRNIHALNTVFSPQSQIYIIDTAIVKSIEDTTRHLYSFNGKAKRTCDLTQKLKGDLWMDSLRETNEYDANGNMLTDLYETWSDGQWWNWARITYTYDANSNRLTYLTEFWSNGQWVGGSRYTYSYDANGNMLTGLWESWSDSQWVNSGLLTCTYDAKGNMLTRLHETWSNDQWVGTLRDTYTYDANDNMLTDRVEAWSSGQWVGRHRYTYTYNLDSNILTYLDEQWSNGQWAGNFRETYTYDSHQNLTSFSYDKWTDSSWTATDYGWGENFSITDSVGNNYAFSSGYNFTLNYNVVETGITSRNDYLPGTFGLSQNYPNPFNPSTEIMYSLKKASNVKLKVYDILGREHATLVQGRQAPGEHSVTWNADVSSGVYFYRLVAGEFVQTKKMVLMR